MEGMKDKLLTMALTPLSWIYGAVTEVRNKFFDWNILPSTEYDVPVICVGNITVGGTGKTPHVEFLVSHLCAEYNIGVLSRGYKRETKGFVLASPHSTPVSIGDEPYQIYRKFGRRATVAVCEDRRKGIKKLMDSVPDIDLIILDDAFQHRYVKPKAAILLMDYSRPVHDDRMLPLGRLRESVTAINRADFVIVTKCPPTMTPLDVRLWRKKLDLMYFQKLCFSHVHYGELTPVFEEEARYSASLASLGEKDSVLLVTGIASPRGIVRYLCGFPFRLKVARFPDHHSFRRDDLEKIANKFKSMPGVRKIIVTTEKDAVRMAANPYFPQELKRFCFYQPISIRMSSQEESDSFLDDLRGVISQKGDKEKK